MKQFTKYICVFLVIAGMSVNVWGTTTTEVIFPAGTTSSYTPGDWGDHGAYIGGYPTTESTESMCISDGVGFDVKFYYAYDGDNSNGLQLKKNSSAYVEMTIASSNGITVEVTYSATSDFDIDLTGASTVTASSDNTTASINTNNTSATLKINGTSNVVYIKYIKITRKSTGTITIGHDDCTVGANIVFSSSSISKTVTPAEAESGGTFSTVKVSGVNIYDGTYDCENWVSYAFDSESASGASGTYGTDWEFSVEAASTSEYWTCIDYGVGAFSNEVLTISYSFLSEPDPGTYTADLIARTWDEDWNAYDFTIPVTLTVASSCSTSPTVTAGSLKGSVTSSSSATVQCTSGISNIGGTGCSLTSYGFAVGTSENPTIGGTLTGTGKTYEVGSSIAASTGFEKLIDGLSANTTYYVRPYATNGHGTAYGTQASFKTLQRYAITYYKNDGGATSDTEYKDHGANYTISSDKYSRSGHTLVKWHTLAAGTGGTDYALGVTYSLNAALNLYAVWGGTISFNNNGGSGSMSSELVVNGGSYSLPSCTFTAPSGKLFDGWAEGSSSGTKRAVGYSHTVSGNITFYAKWRDVSYTDAKFSCAEWSVTGPSRDTVFITSTASKTVRSQEAFHVTASGLPASTALMFATFPTNTRFEFKKADGTAIETDEYGKVNTDFYIFYTPTSGDTSDGLDEITKIYVSVNGEPRKDTLDTKVIYGRHLPEKFVIAAKRDGKWLALPSNMASTSTPSPVEIAVDHADNPTIAYTAATNTYSLYDQAAGEYIKLAMNGQSDAPLYGSGSTAPIGKSGNAIITNTLNDDGYFWKLVQSRATGLSNAKQAKYTIYCKNNSTNHLRLKENSGNPIWGLYDSGIEELRLIPASTVGPTEAYFVEWAQHGGVIEVNAEGVGATKVQAVLNGTESAIKSLTQTCTSVKNRASIYNYTLNFNDVGHVIDLAASTSNGAMLTLRWLDNSEDLVAVSNITVPKIVATSTTMSAINSGDDPWLQMEAHVLPGVTLTANAGDFKSNDVTIKHLEIYPGATVVVTKGEAGSGTLTTKTLVLRNGWSRAGTKTYDVARLFVTASTATLKATNVYADWYIDYDQYYPIAVPWNATVANFTYRYCTVSPTVGYNQNIRLRYYDGASRATNVQEGVGSGANWKAYGDDDCDDVPDALLPSHGYIMTAKRPSGKAFSIIRMPLTLPSGTWADGAWTTSGESGSVSTTHKDEIAVTAHNSGSTPGYAQGWNLIANPYMALHQGALTYNDGSGDEIEYANVPDINFTEYDQLPIATTKLKPSSAFLVQAPKNGTVTFGTANRKASAPSSYRNEAPKASKQKAYILLNGNEAEDQMGIIIGEQYTAAYELNADLEKLLSDGTSLRTYMLYGDRNMAYVAINAELAKEMIPVTVRIPANGEYTFSLHEASTAGELEGVYLTDYLAGTTTNLLYDNYMFTAEAGTNAERFAINAIVGERKTPTGVDIPGVDKNGTEPVKFIWHDKVFILHNNVIYDSTGKRVNVINK